MDLTETERQDVDNYFAKIRNRLDTIEKLYNETDDKEFIADNIEGALSELNTLAYCMGILIGQHRIMAAHLQELRDAPKASAAASKPYDKGKPRIVNLSDL